MTYKFNDQFSKGLLAEWRLDQFFSQKYILSLATREQQRQGIDRWFTAEDGSTIAVEYKADWRASQTKNAFIETISVDSRNVLGWVYTSRADALAYFLPDVCLCWLICFVQLRERLADWIAQYPVRKVSNFGYCTHGILVPLSQVRKIVFEEVHIE